MLAFTGAQLQSGIDIVIAATKLEQKVKQADLVITGEGQIDSQTAFGKTPAGVARVAGKYGVPVVAIGGSLADDAGVVFSHGIQGIEAAVARTMSLDHALDNAPVYISNAAERLLRLLIAGSGMKKQ